jgi:hypothetical protein
VLSRDKGRFWLMVEPGDVDWANHDDNLDNSIGAVNSGDAAVRVITDWVEQNSNWNESLLIVTADHGHMLNISKPEVLAGAAGTTVARLADPPGIHNLLQAAPHVFSGSEPAGEPAFRSLRELGVTMIVSVDGAEPDVTGAAKFGLRYVHIPIGYDGIDTQAGRALARAAKEATGNIYVHCHHGRHRGPAAAAVVCMAAGSLTAEQSAALLAMAGTSPDYAGLWRRCGTAGTEIQRGDRNSGCGDGPAGSFTGIHPCGSQGRLETHCGTSGNQFSAGGGGGG